MTISLEQAGSMPISPVKVRDLQRFLSALEPLAADLVSGDLVGALVRHADRVIEATAIGAGIDRAALEDADADVLVVLAGRVIEANADFFIQRVMPALTMTAERLAALSLPSSTTGSSGSAPQA